MDINKLKKNLTPLPPSLRGKGAKSSPPGFGYGLGESRLNSWKKWSALLILIMLGGVLSETQISAAPNPSGNRPNAAVPQASKPPVLLGLYAENYLGDQSVIDKELRQIDDWSGKRHSLAGFFMNMEDSNPAYNVGERLERLRKNGYTAFINLDTTRTTAQIAKGDIDNSLRKVAKAYAEWSSKGEGRIAFIAPLQEMNIGGDETYGKDPENFKLAYQRIQQIFAEAGVTPNAVRWVFAPNGWSDDNHRFEKYYPGSDRVDVVAFSAYNWGYCPKADWKNWGNAAAAFQPYIERMRQMAPGKPIFIAQTASTSYTQGGANSSAKDQWFRDAYSYLASAPGVQGILYFNLNKECDWALSAQNSGKSDGYKDAVANPAFSYVSPTDLAQTKLGQ